MYAFRLAGQGRQVLALGRHRTTGLALIALPTVSQRKRAAFTLIELLVVVAIIALLIAILLPSLNAARAQARTTLCASRIGHLVKAVLLYADDYSEMPPFMGRGWEDCSDDARLDSEIWPAGSGLTLRDWARFENWLMPEMPGNPDDGSMPPYWLSVQDDWPSYARPSNGSLFSYTRFEALYLCPEFQRVADPSKSQNVFNYTRLVHGRKWFHRGDPEGNPDAEPPSIWLTSEQSENWCGQAGPIMSLSQIHASAKLRMFLDEQWNRHCAAPEDQFEEVGQPGTMLNTIIHEQWYAADCLFGTWGSEIGQYHGTKGFAKILPASALEPKLEVKAGSIACYDGHVELERDPMPGRDVDVLQLFQWGLPLLVDWTKSHIWAQRGLSPEHIVFDLGALLS